VIDRATLRRLSRRSNTRGLLQLGAHLTLLGTTGAVLQASRGHVWCVPALLVHGIALVFCFCPLHESVHRTAFKSRWMNDAVAWVCGVLLVLPREYFRLFHFAHHRFTQDAEHDPELTLASPENLGAYLLRMSGLPNWRNRLSTTLGHAVSGKVTEAFVPEAKRPAIVREARILWAVYVAIFCVSIHYRTAAALIYWILPMVAGQPFLRMFLLAEHTGCARSSDMFANTRTTYTNPLVRTLAWQMPFHVEHHAYPAVPFHALGEVNALIRQRIAVSAPGYLAMHREFIQRLRAARGTGRPA
jgi:fatty acid desaturase